MRPLLPRSRVRQARWIAPVGTLLVAAALAMAQTDEGPATPASLRAVRYNVEPGRTRVWFETSRPVLYTHYSPDPLTLVIDLPGVEVTSIPDRTVVGSREVESIVATKLDGSNGRTLSRIEIKLVSMVHAEVTANEQALTVVFGEPAPSADLAPAPDAAAAQASGEPAIRETPLPVPIPRPEAVASRAKPPLEKSPATLIRSVNHEVAEDLLSVTVAADGRLSYSSFRLENPNRLVFDFSGVLNRVPQAQVALSAAGVARARIAQYRTSNPAVTRIVFDLSGRSVHRAVEEGKDLRIYFATSPERLAKAVPLAAMEESVVTPSPGTLPSTIEAWSLASPLKPVAVVAQSPITVLPASASIPILPSPAPSLLPPAQGPGPAAQPSPGSFGARTVGPEEKVYTGDLISLDFKDGDIQDIFRLFAEISGLNVVVQPGVTGRVTLKLNEVPWDQALELVLKTNKLGYIEDGNVVRIAPLSQLAEEEAERRKLAEEKALAGELNTLSQQLSYAKAKTIEPLLKRNLSPRGDIVIDDRTNTLIITDLPTYLTNVQELLKTLDTPIPGVEIEARIIVTTRTFARQLGIQWGFSARMDPFFGNTTELVFPNSVQVAGQAIGSQATDEFNIPGGTGGLIPPAVGVGQVPRGYAVNLPTPASPTGAIGVSLGSITGAFSIDAAIAAAETLGTIRILSAPKIITQNNTPASIKQGVSFPVQTVANNTVTVQFRDAVLELVVTPQITSADTIILDLNVNNNSLDFGRAVNGIPSIITQSATTQVLVADGSTTVIGGVFVNQDSVNNRYVPLLHKIPILGYLFKSNDISTSNQELLIFVTPRIRKGQA